MSETTKVLGQDKPKDLSKDERKEINDGKRYQVWLVFPNGESKKVKSRKHDYDTWEQGDVVRDHLEDFLDSDSYANAPSGVTFQSRTVRVELREVKG